jgi:hypothetical protein
MFLRPDMVNAMRQDGVRLGKLTVLAATLRPLPNLLAPKFRHDLT